jgi:hypothetical protein
MAKKTSIVNQFTLLNRKQSRFQTQRQAKAKDPKYNPTMTTFERQPKHTLQYGTATPN